MDFLLIAMAILPVLVLMIYIYRKDKFQKEPIRLLSLAFIGGILAIPTDLILVKCINSVYYSESVFYSAFIEAGLCEELCKFLFLFWFIWRKKDFDEYMDGIVYATFVSLGFACVENIMYVLDYGMGTAIMRAILSVPGHFLFGVAMGYFFGLAKFEKRKRPLYLILSVLIPFILHGLFDWLLMISDVVSPGVTMTILALFIVGDIMLWKLGIKYIRKHQQLTMNQVIEDDSDDTIACTGDDDSEYTHIDWNAGEKS